jgi:hypothetical protein
LRNSRTVLTIAVLATALNPILLPAEPQYQNVLALRPLSFWPADEGEGRRLRDLGSLGNSANVFNTPWAGKALDFTGGFEYVEIPEKQEYLSRELSLGAWVFVRRPQGGRNHASRSTTLLGNWNQHWSKRPGPISLRLTGEGRLTVEVVSSGVKDSLGSTAAGVCIEPEAWQHVLYTYKNGEGRLYVGGKLVCSKSGVAYEPQAGEFIAGSDSAWWSVHPPTSGALDGSLREIVIFDRAINGTEAGALASIGGASVQPRVVANDELRLHGRFVKLGELGTLSQQDQRLAIRFMRLSRYGWAGDLEANAGVLRPYLVQALRQALPRYDAALLLEKMKDHQTLAEAKSHLLATIRATVAGASDRATATLALARLGPAARDVVGTLVTLLREDVRTRGTHVPRVEDAFRNALVTACLAIDGDGADVRRALGEAYAKPILMGMDLAKPHMEEVGELVAQNRFMDALDTCKPIIKEQKLYFRSQNDPSRDQRDHWAGNSRAYTAVDEYNGYTYTFGNGKAFDGCSPITQVDYERAVKAFSEDHPEATEWFAGKIDTMFRADLTRTAPDGSVQTVYMGGENFIFSGRDAKTKAWSVAVDKNGYIHAMGGQHNFPRSSEFMPGSWESNGLSSTRGDADHPTTLYWISKRPEDITEFEFVGRKGHPLDIPVPYMNYMNFVQDRDEELYLYGRNDKGIQNWAWYRYDADARKWHDLGGARADIFASARKADPDWVQSVKESHAYCYRGTIPTGSEWEYPSLSWTWQPHFYNYIRSTRGVQFDPENRMYIQIPTFGYDANRRARSAELFAYSDDSGKTFHRADGSDVKLPLTSNPAPEHNADTLKGYNEIWITQWTDLIKRIGFIF